MPEKSTQFRAKQAKAKGTTMTTKASAAETGLSSHAAKKSGSVTGRLSFTDRTVSARSVPGHGSTHESVKLPLPDRRGSSSSRRETLPPEGAKNYRKEGREKKPR